MFSLECVFTIYMFSKENLWAFVCYIRQGAYVYGRFVGLSLKQDWYQTDFHKTLWQGVSGGKEEFITFWGRSELRGGSMELVSLFRNIARYGIWQSAVS